MTFVEKPLLEGYGDILDDHIIFDYWSKEITDCMYADNFKMLYYKQFISNHGTTYFYDGVFWDKDRSSKHIMMNNMIDSGFKEHILMKAEYIIPP